MPLWCRTRAVSASGAAVRTPVLVCSGRKRPDLRAPRSRTSSVRRGFIAAVAAVGLLVGADPTDGASCAAPQRSVARLPAPVTVTTDCGRYRFGRDGRMRFERGFALPVPFGASYYIDLSWYRIQGDRLSIGRAKR